jgi:hypothetical protein
LFIDSFEDEHKKAIAMQSIEEMVAKIFATRRITRTDQMTLMTMFTQGGISANDEMLINQIYEALNQGRLRVVE